MNTGNTGYNFNNIEEIKSHSSVLFNERLAILFYWLDIQSIEMNQNPSPSNIYKVRSTLKQIYMNIRPLIYLDPIIKVKLNLITNDEGIYVPDVMQGVIDEMTRYCEKYNAWTIEYLHIIKENLNEFQTLLRNILQYYHYFIRPSFKQKPDIDQATMRYQEITDSMTLEQLRRVVGKNHKLDFEALGRTREITRQAHYDNEEDDDELLDVISDEPEETSEEVVINEEDKQE